MMNQMTIPTEKSARPLKVKIFVSRCLPDSTTYCRRELQSGIFAIGYWPLVLQYNVNVSTQTHEPQNQWKERLIGLIVAMSLIGREEPFADWGLLQLAKVQKSFKREDGLYREELGKRNPAFNWGVGVMLSALNAAASLDPAWKKELRSFIKSSRVYWNPAGPVAGFDVLPMPKSVDRFYDDNAWMVLGLVEASDVLGDTEILGEARKALDYVLSGEDETLGGGIYWREKEKESKNTCSNGPSVAACLAVYERTREADLLAKAIKLYAWTKNRFQDPDDSLFWDSVGLKGAVDKTKWSYNTALMIQSAAILGRITHDKKYLTDAETMAASSEMKWLVNGRIADEGKFAFLLLDSWSEVKSASRDKGHRQVAQWLWNEGRDKDGWFGNRYDRPPTKGHRPTLIDQAAAIRTLLTVPPEQFFD